METLRTTHSRSAGRWSCWLLALLVLLAGCTFGGPPARPDAPSGTLRWSIAGVNDVSSLDPARPEEQQSNVVINLVFAGLVRLDNNLKVVPDGAERWQVSADGTVYTFTIRENLKFADGTQVTAHDFLYAINRALAPETASYGAPDLLRHIIGAQVVANGGATAAKGVRALDDRTLQIQLDAPLAYFLSQLTYTHTFPVPRALIEAEGPHWTERAYGTGPYRVKEWQHGTKIVLEANPHYWQGPPGVAIIEMPIFKEADAAYQAYRAGQIDVMGGIQGGVPATRIAEVQGLPDLRETNTLTVRYVGFNNSRPPFNNQSVRQAFALAVDKQLLAQQVLADTVTPADRILPEGMPAANLPIKGEIFDPVGARAALGLAGYISGQALPPITLTYSNDGDNPRVALALQSFWRDTLGVRVQLQGLDLDQFIRRMNETYADPANGMDMYLSIWGADYPDPHNFLSQQLRSNSPYNNGHWSHSQFDGLVTRADRMGSQEQFDERMRIYNQAEQIAVTNVGWLPLYNPRARVLIRPTVQGLFFTPQGIIAPAWTRVRVES